MVSRNDVTGDALQTKVSSDSYRSNWDKIFGKKTDSEPMEPETPVADVTEGSENLTKHNVLLDRFDDVDVVFEYVVSMKPDNISTSEGIVVYELLMDLTMVEINPETEFYPIALSVLPRYLDKDEVSRLNNFIKLWEKWEDEWYEHLE